MPYSGLSVLPAISPVTYTTGNKSLCCMECSRVVSNTLTNSDIGTNCPLILRTRNANTDSILSFKAGGNSIRIGTAYLMPLPCKNTTSSPFNTVLMAEAIASCDTPNSAALLRSTCTTKRFCGASTLSSISTISGVSSKALRISLATLICPL